MPAVLVEHWWQEPARRFVVDKYHPSAFAVASRHLRCLIAVEEYAFKL
jgi:hypothetical protein